MSFRHKNINIKLTILDRFKSARLFGRNLCVWDFFLKVTMDFNQSIAHHLQASSAANQGSTVAYSTSLH